MSDRSILVTGGCGFIGSSVTRSLVKRGHSVRVLDNLYRSSRDTIADLMDAGDVEFVEGDVRYAPSVDAALEGVDRVIHLAALAINKSVADPVESLEVNLMGSENVFRLAARHGVKRVVFSSSASVYGEPEGLPMSESDMPGPATPYCVSKLASEHLLDFYARRHGMGWLALRFFNVYGPGQKNDAYYTSVILTFLGRILGGQPPVIHGDGKQSMDFVHISDVTSAVVAALESDASGLAINVGTGVETTIADVAVMLLDETGLGVDPVFEPRDVLVTRRAADITLAREVLGWEPTVSAEEGLREFVGWVVDSRGV